MLIGIIAGGCNSSNKLPAADDSLLSKIAASEDTASSVNHSTLKDTLDGINKVVVTTIESDTMNFEEDSNYGIGDDDAFSAEDFKVYSIKNGAYRLI